MKNLNFNPSSVRARTRDGFTTFDAAVVNTTGAFFVNELERLDPTLNQPLFNVTWSRDVTLRTDVTMADDASSFTVSDFTMPTSGGWAAKNTTQLVGPSVSISRTPQALNIWAAELAYSIPELESAQKLGRPIDAQKFAAMNMTYQMLIDQCVYKGGTDINTTGLINSSAVTSANATTGNWASATADQILADVNTLLTNAWEAAAYAFAPSDLLLPPAQFAMLVSKKVSDAGNISVLEYLKLNSISLAVNGQSLRIGSTKHLTGSGASGKDRAVAYTNRTDLVRYPLVPIQRAPLQFRGIYHVTPYLAKLGQIEIVYPEAIQYMDGI